MNVVYQIKIGPWKQIGSTNNLKKRMKDHFRELAKGTHGNSIMQRAYLKYNMFEYEILSEYESREEAYLQEQLLLDKFFKKPYYSMQCASASGSGSGDKCIMFGKKRPEQSQFMRFHNPMKNKKIARELGDKLKIKYTTDDYKKKFQSLWTNEKKIIQSKKLSGASNGRSQKVLCIESGTVFLTIQDAAKFFNRSSATISRWNKNKIKVKFIYDK